MDYNAEDYKLLLPRKRKQLKLLQKDAAEILNISRLTYIKYENTGEIPDRKKNIIDMFLKSESLEDLNNKLKGKKPDDYHIINATFISSADYKKIIEEKEPKGYLLNFVFKKSIDGNFIALEINNTSMDDGSNKGFGVGDLVLAKEIKNINNKHILQEELQEKEIYIIVFGNEILCKRIDEIDFNNDKILCHSLNPSPEYSDFELNISGIKKLYRVIKRVI